MPNLSILSPASNKLTAIVLAFALLMLPLMSSDKAKAQTGSESAAAQQVVALLGKVDRSKGSLDAATSAVKSHFAIGTWVNALLGKEGKKFSSGQKSEFRRLLPRYLGKLYVNQFGRQRIGEVNISRVRTVRGDVIVTTKLPRGGGRTIPVDWRLRSIGGKFRVIDYSVGGVSNVVLKRSEFTGKVKKSGPQSLNSFLKAFIAR